MSAKILLLLCVLACQQDTILSQTSPPYCVYNSTVYKLSSGFKVDLCTLGYCDSNGNVTIATICCDELPCPNPVHGDDECCPRCPDVWVPTCIFEGQIYNVGTIPTNNPCQFCECPPTGGEPMCAWAECALCPDDQFGFPVPVPGTNLCCPPCTSSPTTSHPPVCDYNGQIFEINSTVQIDACRSAYCDLYVGVTFYATCCLYEYQIYQLDSYFSLGVCEWGHCGSDGQVTLKTQGCPYCENPISVPGQCCPRCDDYHEEPCYFEGQVYNIVGPIQTKDLCQTCMCLPGGGDAQCMWEGCETCGDETYYVSLPGKCCGVCYPKDCEYNATSFQLPWSHSNIIPTGDPCLDCVCTPTGKKECTEIACAPCSYYDQVIRHPDQCCPSCKPRDYITPFTPTPGHGCYYNGEFYGAGPVPSNNPCETCECPPWGGEPDCFWATCPPCADNEMYVSVPGQCCGVCEVFTTTPDPTTCYYNYSGQGYQDNIIPTGDPCLDCVCTPPGIKQCTEIACSPCPDYLDVVWYPGRCCPGCEPRDSTSTPPMTPPSCYYDGQTYEPGPVPSTNRCETCECPSWGGDVECLAVPCGTCPSQVDDYTPPSECCPRCPITQP